MTNTVITFENESYELVYDAVADNCGNGELVYTAKAIKVGEPADELGQPTYRVFWEVLENWDGEVEEYACDWENPDMVEAL